MKRHVAEAQLGAGTRGQLEAVKQLGYTAVRSCSVDRWKRILRILIPDQKERRQARGTILTAPITVDDKLFTMQSTPARPTGGKESCTWIIKNTLTIKGNTNTPLA